MNFDVASAAGRLYVLGPQLQSATVSIGLRRFDHSQENSIQACFGMEHRPPCDVKRLVWHTSGSGTAIPVNISRWRTCQPRISLLSVVALIFGSIRLLADIRFTRDLSLTGNNIRRTTACNVVAAYRRSTWRNLAQPDDTAQPAPQQAQNRCPQLVESTAWATQLHAVTLVALSSVLACILKADGLSMGYRTESTSPITAPCPRRELRRTLPLSAPYQRTQLFQHQMIRIKDWSTLRCIGLQCAYLWDSRRLAACCKRSRAPIPLLLRTLSTDRK
jgi:hypothetical protein